MRIDIEPCWHWVEKNTHKQQIRKVRAELREVEKAYYQSNAVEMKREYMDVIQACITALAKLGVEQKELDGLLQELLEKNQERGYYGRTAG